jgi:hypothetical protein
MFPLNHSTSKVQRMQELGGAVQLDDSLEPPIFAGQNQVVLFIKL